MLVHRRHMDRPTRITNRLTNDVETRARGGGRHTGQMEAERIMAQLQSENERQDAVPDDGSPKYMPSTDDTDPIVRALKTVLKCKEVTGVCVCVLGSSVCVLVRHRPR